MSYIFQMENVCGRCIEFLEPENGNMKSAMRMRPYGKEVTGTLALQIFSDRPYKRITFADPKNVYIAAAKDIFGYMNLLKAKDLVSTIVTGSKITKRNDLCHFDFSADELRRGRKLLRFEIQMVGNLLPLYSLCCYDFDTHMGTCYKLSDYESMRQWGKVLAIHQVTVLTHDGDFVNVKKI